MPTPFPSGFAHHPLYFAPHEQAALVDAVVAGLTTAPLYQPTMPRTGAPLSVRMSNFGPLGWVTDREGGYRYQAHHPVTGAPWPDLPDALLALWRDVTDWPDPPEACLINWYGKGARMGAHVDRDEHDLRAPVVSVSLGDPATFRMGGRARGGPTAGLKLFSGDVVVMAGEARGCHHAVTRIFHGETALLPEASFPGGGRLNLTMRVVGAPG